MAENVIIKTLTVKHLLRTGGSIWERLLELTSELPTPASQLWRVESRRLYRMKKVAGLRLRSSDSLRPANGWWGRSLSGRLLPILRTRFTRSSGLWDAAS